MTNEIASNYGAKETVKKNLKNLKEISTDYSSDRTNIQDLVNHLKKLHQKMVLGGGI